MKLGKVINGNLAIIEIAEEELESKLADGYELICETEKESEDAVCSYIRISNGWVENWQIPPMDEEG